MIRSGSFACGLAVLLGGTGLGQVTERVSVSSAEAQASGGSYHPSISADGGFVAFSSDATNLVPGDTNVRLDIFVRDRQLGTTERVSVDSAGLESNGHSQLPCISSDGRYVVFGSSAGNLVAGDTNATSDIFLRDRQLGTTERVNVSSAGAQANSISGDYRPAISADGRFVAFQSRASNLVPGDTNSVADAFVRDRQLGTTERVSVSTAGAEGDAGCQYVAISSDGRYVAFDSLATDLAGADTNGVQDVFVRDRQLGVTECVSVTPAGSKGNGVSVYPAISSDGRYVAFYSEASDLVPGDTNAWGDIFVRDRLLGTTVRVSVGPGGVQGNGNCAFASISADGRYVGFNSFSTNLVAGDTNVTGDAFVHDRQLGTTLRVSVGQAGAQGNDLCFTSSISADGRCVAFQSRASNLVASDTNALDDVFVRGSDASGATSLCDPGANGVIACPCQNPPSGPGRGCDNSSATGGAQLAPAGSTLLSSDSLVFTTTGQKPTAASMLVQGTAAITGGAIYGQGVRCVGGSIARLYTRGASGGSITVPDFGSGEPPISVRSAALGDSILAGQSRWYLVFYRDATVLGSCPPASNFNVTQTVQVAWGQ